MPTRCLQGPTCNTVVSAAYAQLTPALLNIGVAAHLTRRMAPGMLLAVPTAAPDGDALAGAAAAARGEGGAAPEGATLAQGEAAAGAAFQLDVQRMQVMAAGLWWFDVLYPCIRQLPGLQREG